VLAEDALRRFAVAGLALLVTLAAALLAQWC
jgi:hypothetical protein